MNKADYLAFPAVVGTTGQFNNMRKLWDEQHFKCHLDRIAKTKQMVDNKAPRTYVHCHLNMKKIQKEQERQMEIERDNRLLASRIACITGTKGGLDNWNDYLPKPSMNADLWRRELGKISLENKAIFKKISMVKSVYDHRLWLQDYMVTRGYVNRLMKYPETPRPTRPYRLLNLV